MASSLRLISSNLVTRSVVVPTLVSCASRFLSIEAGRRSYTTMPTTDDMYDPSWLKIQCPKISSMTFCMDMSAKSRRLKLKIHDEDVSVDLKMSGLKKEDMRACGEHNTFIQGKTHKAFDLAGMNLQEEITSKDIKEGKHGILLKEIPSNKEGIITNIIANEIISSFRDITTEHSWAYYDLFYDRSILNKRLCPLIAKMSLIHSFSMYKEETPSELCIKMSMPGLHRMKLTTQGLRVSLNMCGLKRKDVKAFFDYDTFFIEAKTKTEHHITCIHLPEGIHKKNSMIKREMKDEVFYATIPCCVKKEELQPIEDQLKPKFCITKGPTPLYLI